MEGGRGNPSVAELLSNEAREEAIASSNSPYRKRLKTEGGQRDKSLFHLTGVRFLKSGVSAVAEGDIQ